MTNTTPPTTPPAVPAAGSAMERVVEAARKWCRENAGWEPICDMGSTDHLYFGWADLSKRQKLSWRLKFGSEAEAAFLYQVRPCKVNTGFIDERGRFTKETPFGILGMMVFHTQNPAPHTAA